MRKTIFIIGILITVIVAVIIWFIAFFDQKNDALYVSSTVVTTDGSGAEKNSASTTTGALKVYEEKQNKGLSAASSLTFIPGQLYQELARKFREARTALEAEHVAEEAEINGIESAADWKYQIDVVCLTGEPEYIEMNKSAKSDPFVQKLKSYCAYYTTNEQFENLGHEFVLRSLDLYAQKVVDRLIAKWKNIPSEVILKQVNEFIRSAHTPEELSGLAEYLSLYEQETHQTLLQPDENGDFLPSERAVFLQKEALELIACSRFGGCGADSLITIRNCAAMPVCGPGWTYEDFVVATTSPVEMEYIRHVIGQIFIAD